MEILKCYLNFFSAKDYQEKEIMTKISFFSILIMILCFSALALIIIFSIHFLFGKFDVGTGIKRSIYQIYMNSVIISPIIEELMFRFPLLLISKVLTKWKHVVMFFYLLISFFFGLLHIFNYENASNFTSSQIIILTLPQIFVGFILGWVCLKYKNGLWWCILLHASYNFIVITISL